MIDTTTTLVYLEVIGFMAIAFYAGILYEKNKHKKEVKTL